MASASKARPLLTAWHWLLAAGIMLPPLRGVLELIQTAGADPGALGALGLRMTAGLLILMLMGVRVAILMRAAMPVQINPGVSAGERAAILRQMRTGCRGRCPIGLPKMSA